MKWIAGTLILLATTAPGGAAAPPEKSAVTDYFPLTPGLKWSYELDLGDGRKIGVANHAARVETIDGKPLVRMETYINGRVMATEHLLATRQGVYRHRMGEAEVAPPFCFLKYPYREGESWEAEPRIRSQQMKFSFKNGRTEEVVTPAGKYRAVSVILEMTANGSPSKTTSWYVHGIGMVKRIVEIGAHKTTFNLVKFEAGKPVE